jgi:hypothetical protein
MQGEEGDRHPRQGSSNENGHEPMITI